MATTQEPLYKKVKDGVLASIRNGEYNVNERLPTEAELTKIYQVSRITVRKALEELAYEGYIDKRQGDGTYISHKKISRNLSRNISFSEMCRSIGCKPGAKVIKCILEHATEQDISELGVEKDSLILSIERIRYADFIPVSIEICRFRDSFLFLMNEDLNNTSLYELLAKKYDVHFVDSRKYLEIDFATLEQSKYLALDDHYPLLKISSVVSDITGIPAFSSLQFIVGDRFRFTI